MRPKGTPNKRTVEIEARLAKLGCDPIEGMALIAASPDASLELRGRMYAELAQYVAPKRKALEVTGEVTHNYVARMPEQARTADEWHRQIAPPQIN